MFIQSIGFVKFPKVHPPRSGASSGKAVRDGFHLQFPHLTHLKNRGQV